MPRRVSNAGRRIAARPHERPQDEPLAVGAQAQRRHEAVGRQLALVAGRHEQVPAALALVGPDDPQVAHRPHPLVVEEPEHPRRHVEHDRAWLGVDHGDAVDRLGVAGERQPVGVGVEDQDVGRAHVQVARERRWKPQIAAAIMWRRNTWQAR